jgi:hypothetical protein
MYLDFLNLCRQSVTQSEYNLKHLHCCNIFCYNCDEEKQKHELAKMQFYNLKMHATRVTQNEK